MIRISHILFNYFPVVEHLLFYQYCIIRYDATWTYLHKNHCVHLLFPSGKFLKVEFCIKGKIFKAFKIYIPNCSPESCIYLYLYQQWIECLSTQNIIIFKFRIIWWEKNNITSILFAFLWLLETELVIFISYLHIFICQLTSISLFNTLASSYFCCWFIRAFYIMMVIVCCICCNIIQ